MEVVARQTSEWIFIFFLVVTLLVGLVTSGPVGVGVNVQPGHVGVGVGVAPIGVAVNVQRRPALVNVGHYPVVSRRIRRKQKIKSKQVLVSEGTDTSGTDSETDLEGYGLPPPLPPLGAGVVKTVTKVKVKKNHPVADKRVGVEVPGFYWMDLNRNPGGTNVGLSVLGGLVQVGVDRRVDPATGRKTGPIMVSVGGVPIFNSMITGR